MKSKPGATSFTYHSSTRSGTLPSEYYKLKRCAGKNSNIWISQFYTNTALEFISYRSMLQPRIPFNPSRCRHMSATLVHMVMTPTAIGSVHAAGSSSLIKQSISKSLPPKIRTCLDARSASNTAFHLQHRTRDLITESDLALMVMLLNHMALIGAMRCSWGSLSGCFHSLRACVWASKPCHEGWLGGSGCLGGAAAMEHFESWKCRSRCYYSLRF